MSDLNGDAAIDRFFESGGQDVPPDLGAPAPDVVDTPPPEVKTEAPPAPEPPKQEAPKEEPRVPLQALHEERRKRQELEQRLAALEGRITQPPKDEPKIPTVEEDPVGHFKAKIEQIERTAGETAQQFAARQQFEAFAAHVSTREQQFATANPDYYEATEHLHNALASFFEEQGLDPEQAKVQAGNAAHSLAVNAVNNRRDPAAAAYNLAKKYGWQPKAAAPPASGEKATPERGADGKFVAAQEKIATVAKGQAAAKSLGAASGTAPENDGLSALLRAADDPTSSDFDGLWEKTFGRDKNRALFR